MKIIALSVGSSTTASTQYRLGQFVDSLATKDIALDITPAGDPERWPDLKDYDLVIIQKKLLRIPILKQIRKNAKRLVFDTDDAIWEPHEKKHFFLTRLRTNSRLRAVLSAADLCTVPNLHLSKYVTPLTKRVELIQMALDGDTWYPHTARESGPLRIGWAGAPHNLSYLSLLETPLLRMQEKHPETQLIIYGGKAPTWNSSLKSIHHPYSPGTEPDAVRNFDIGLLPLPNNRFAAGKSPIKAIQYAACGIPCIASPVGATCEIVKDTKTGLDATTPQEWESALNRLIESPELTQKLGKNARAHFLKNHSRHEVEKKLIACWEETVRKVPPRNG